MSVRAVAVVFNAGDLLVIAREKDGKQYLVLPGGGIEAGETPQRACLRELREETGLEGEILAHLAVHGAPDREAVYFALSVRSRQLHLSGPEAERMTSTNRYEPQWVDPRSIVHLVPTAARHAAREGWQLAHEAPFGCTDAASD